MGLHCGLALHLHDAPSISYPYNKKRIAANKLILFKGYHKRETICPMGRWSPEGGIG